MKMQRQMGDMMKKMGKGGMLKQAMGAMMGKGGGMPPAGGMPGGLGDIDPKQLEEAAKKMGAGKSGLPGGLPGLGGGLPMGLSGFGKKK